MKKLLHIGLFSLALSHTIGASDNQKTTYTNFDKKELKNLIKKSGTGLKIGDYVYCSSFFGGGYCKNADKENVRHYRKRVTRATIEAIDECMIGKSKHDYFDQQGSCQYAFTSLQKIKRGFWILPATRFKKLYKISEDVKNKLNESMHDFSSLGIEVRTSDMVLAKNDLKKINSFENNIRDCLNNTMYGDSCRNAKYALREFKKKDTKNPGLYKQALTKIKEFKKNAPKESSIKEQK